MDLDDARDSIMRAPDVPAISNVLLSLLDLLGAMDGEIERLGQRLKILERDQDIQIQSIKDGHPHASL